jgi:peptidoglycan/LPS O-acetylase OafA/YrhL
MRLGNIINSGKDNNFNSIRLLLSLSVIISHSYPICFGAGGEAKGEPLMHLTDNQMALGSAAVNLFFVISGMLITASWLRSRSMTEYLWKRVLRIYPAFIVALFFSGIVIWVACPEFREATGRGISWSFLFLRDCIFLGDQSLGAAGVFANNPWHYNANGSLWTIPIEFQCYLLLAAFGFFCVFKYRWFMLGVGIFFFVFYSVRLIENYPVGNHWSRFLTCFMAGVCIWLWRDKLPISKSIAIICLLILGISSQFDPWFNIAMPLFAGYLMIWLAYGTNAQFFCWTKKVDLSYGVYLYAFPVQQMFAMQENLRQPFINCILSIPVTLGLAWISWTFVETRFLSLKNISLQDHDPASNNN